MSGLAKDLTYRLLGEDVSASKTMHGSATVAEAVTGRIGGSFQKLGGVIGGEFGEVLNRVGEGISQVGEHGSKLAVGLTVGGAAVTGLGVALQKMGSGEVQAQAQLKQSITNTGASYGEYQEEIEKTIKSQENFGHSSEDTMTALQHLTQSTGSPKKALSEMGLAADLAGAKHISLTDASDMLGKVLNGKGSRFLTQYGIQMATLPNPIKAVEAAQKQVTSASTGLATAQDHLGLVQQSLAKKTHLTTAEHQKLALAHDKVNVAAGKLTTAQDNLSAAQKQGATNAATVETAVTQLAGKVKGQGAESVDNFSGRIGVLRTKLVDWANATGSKVGPAVTALGPVLSVVGVGLQLMKARQEAATAAQIAGTVVQKASLGGLLLTKVAMIGSAVATGVATAAQWALNAAMDANPIGIIIIAVAALVAGLIWFFTQTKLGQEIWQNVSSFIIGAVQNIGRWFSSVWNGVVAVFSAVIGWVMQNWPLLLTILTGPIGFAVAWVIQHWGQVTQFFRNFVGGVGQIFAGIGSVISGAFKGAANFIIDIFNGINRAINHVIDGINGATKLAGAIGIHIGVIPHLPTLPHLATGGTYTTGGLAVVGENGPEIVKLPANATVYPHGGMPAAGGGAGSVTVNVTLSGIVHGDQHSIAKAIVTAVTNAARSGQIPRNALSTALTGA